MTARIARVGRCYRCVYSWRMRRRSPAMCPRCKSRLWKVPKVRPVTVGHGLGIAELIAPHRTEIVRLAAKYRAENVRVFGSVRRREATSASDVDFLVDWKRSASLFDTLRLRRELAALLGRRAEVVDASRVHWAIRPQVLAEAVPL